MDNMGSAGDAGFDAALKALDELEGNAAPAAIVAPIVVFDLDDDVDTAPTAPMAITPPANGADDDLETVVNASLAKVIVADAEAAAAPTVPAPAVPAPVKSGRPWMLAMMVAALGVFASVLAVIGLIVTSRTVANASLVVADARERQQQLMKVGELIHDLDLIRARQLELLQRQQVAATTTPLSTEAFDKAIDNLRIDIGKRGPEAEVMKTVREGQVDNNQRMNELTLKVMRVEAALTGARRPSLPGGE